MDDIVVECRELTRRYGDFVAVDSLNLTVRKGEIFGLLGPNGAGKTTTILMLLGLTEPTSGSVRVLGLDPTRQPLSIKARVGYLPDQVGFYDGLTARENLIYIAKLNGIRGREMQERIRESLEQVGLSDVADRQVRTFSRGMRQRLGVAEVLLKRPQLIVMDEPTLALDPEAVREFLELIRRLKSDGITIMLSSHLLHQVQAVCDRVGLFYKGRMVLEGTVRDLAQRVLGGAYRIHLEAEGGPAVEDALHRLPDVTYVARDGAQTYHIEARSDLRADVARCVIEAGGKVLALSADIPRLDEIYARYFQKKEVAYAVAA
ncbi:MAG: ABC transporter ATP-binding protein [Roseiflexus sp.]|jgi:ABC-2 type transport system ATP-binding protein|nr:ABC transporter ATP-binding protein [Roseiflexus sp.]MBO9334531.1 ABC transporter ATP-binding protein [Roseiflexus sp.]MBO9366322.1 ABC transporter ATP-binding protein [Roseiflexus sp.]MBO9383959.1 ABC transporter ATP-binding protein [Roseiflexus sp.]MBO9389966.1 ABC transporter ATP-binding protein [Roseiflexus sp.]